MNPLLLQVFRSVVWVYSFITFIPWYFFSGAGDNLERARRLKARSISGHPAGPYRAINSQEKLVAWLHPGVDTIDKMFEYAAGQFPERDCLGTREVLSEEDELQPNGKVFKKVKPCFWWAKTLQHPWERCSSSRWYYLFLQSCSVHHYWCHPIPSLTS